jgi:hypothetical protein
MAERLELAKRLDQLKVVVDWMRENGIQSFSDDGFSVSLSASVKTLNAGSIATVGEIAPQAGVFDDVDGAGVCSCGHSWVEHQVSGCLHGCSHEVCISTPGQSVGES